MKHADPDTLRPLNSQNLRIYGIGMLIISAVAALTFLVPGVGDLHSALIHVGPAAVVGLLLLLAAHLRAAKQAKS